MSLTLGTGPLGRAPAGAFNFDLAAAAPAHRIYWADFLPRVRAVIDGRVVLDTMRGKLLYETGIPPRFYAPLEDFEALERTDHTTHCGFKGDATYFSIADRENAVWAYEEPLDAAPWLVGHGSLYTEKADEWWVEDERVLGGIRDPFHRVDVLLSSRPVTVLHGDTVLAASGRAVLLFETGLPPVAYVPRADVVASIAPVEGKTTVCPYKGEASYWTVAGVDSAAWSYESPRPECTGIEGRVAFDASKVTVKVG